ncbi:MAG TPA: FAD-binding oxidoreductase [Steroidobacteraceae bacterium]|jgi:alkyldihydroxyacetonephosphate synthase|nr:FAD-binding oxidoreductase [Steroidobacteraceae bacterium]
MPSATKKNPLQAQWRAEPLQPSASAALRAIVGAENLLGSVADRFAYARDRLPWGLFQLRAGDLPATLPAAIVLPGSRDELIGIVEAANRLRIRLIPFGAGSGVLGGTLPLSCEVMVDMKRINRLLQIDKIDGTARVQAGMNGGQFEAALNAQGYSANHLPQSIHMSTVGGWAACRGAGQASSRYGKIEDIVIGLEAVLPDARLLHVRPVARRAVGPSIKDLMIGSEGVFGFITELTLRIGRLPEYQAGAVYAFASLQSGLDAMRTIVQREGRPSVMRLYDEPESRARTEGIKQFTERPILGIFKFSGPKGLALAEAALVEEICMAQNAVATDDGPYRHWEETRFQSYSIKWQTAGYCMDTVEVTGSWRALPQMHARMQQAVLSLHPEAHFSAHWSHIYPEGACQYMTLRLPPMDHANAMRLHREAWRRLESICLELGGSIAHHHGVGVFRNEWLRAELGAGLDMLQILKDGIDPHNLLNPGKVGLRAAPGALQVPGTAR